MRLPLLTCVLITIFVVSATTADAEQRATGSALPSAMLEDLFRISSYEYVEFLKGGANTPAERLRQDPAYVGNTATENDSNRGDGSARINLYALGPENTLTLINGRRTSIFADINGIPLAALANVEILKGGASAIYGADAVAGVGNFILLNGPGERPYQGAEIDLLYGNTTENDARVLQGSMRAGVATDRVAIAAAAEYYDREAIFSRDRDISADADRRDLGGTNQRSPTFPGRASFRTNPALASTNRASVLVDPAENNPSSAADYRAFDLPRDAFNFRAYTPAIPEMEKYHYYVAGHYKVFGDALQLYGESLYAKRKQDNGQAPTPFAIQTLAANASPYNPFLGTANDNPAVFATYNDNQLRSIAYRSVRELGRRRSFYDYDYWRYVAGVNGSFTLADNNVINALGYDAALVYERGDYLRIDSGDMLRAPLEGEIAAGNFNPFIGINAPISGTAITFRDGIPTGTDSYDNIAAAQRAAYVGRSFSSDRSAFLDARLFGNFFPSLYQGGIGFSVGAEYRSTRSTHIPDPIHAAGNQLGFTALPETKFRQEVTSWFGELHLPIVSPRLSIAGVRTLTFSAAYRQEEFENRELLTKRLGNFDDARSGRLALLYEPVADLVLRASWSKAIHPPTPADVVAPVTNTVFQIFDPRTGLTLVPPGGVLLGGNPDLTAEVTESYAAGFSWTPTFLQGVRLSADLYQYFTRNPILESDEVAQLAAAGLLPERVTFDPFPFFPKAIEQINAITANGGKRLVNGLDVQASYTLSTRDFGAFTLSLGYNHFLTWKAEPVDGAGAMDFTGDFNVGTTGFPALAPGAIPRHKSFLRGGYTWNGFNLVATTNYISSYLDDPGFILVSEYAPNGERGPERTVSDYITLDMQASYEFMKADAEAAAGYSKDRDRGGAMQPRVAGVQQGSFFQRMLWGTEIRAGVVNAFDRPPPTVLGALNDNYDTSLYTIRNRYWYVGVTKTF